MLRVVNVVRFIPVYDCFAHLDIRKIGITDKNVNCVKISWEDNSCLLWCVDSYSAEGCIGINCMFARRLGLDEGTAICIAPYTSPPALQRITIHPETEEDLEILESNALQLQGSLLNQIKVLEKDKKMVMWVSPSLSINIVSSDTCTLQQQTEVVISFQNKEQSYLTGNQSEKIKEPQEASKTNISYYVDSLNKQFAKHEQQDNTILGRILISNKLSNLSQKSVFETDQMFVVFIPSNLHYIDEGIYKIGFMESASDNQERKPLYLVNSIFVNVQKIDPLPMKEFKMMDEYVPMVITKRLSDLLNVDFGKKAVLEKITKDTSVPERIELSPEFKDNPINTDDLLNDFKLFITTHYSKENPFLINNNFIINLLPFKNVSCQINLYPSNMKFVRLYGDMFRRCKVVVNSDPVQPYDNVTSSHVQFDVDETCRSVACFENIIDNCKNILKYSIMFKGSLNQSTINKNHILITGSPGSGKTSLCHSIVSDLGIWFTRLECRSIKGRKDILEHFNRVLQLCEEHNPSVLICDDIDSIIPQQGEEIAQLDATFYDLLIYSIRDLLKHCMGVFVLLTATSLENINSGFHVTKGELLVPFHFSIPDFSQSERIELLKFITANALYNSQHVTENDYNLMGIETEGFVIRDLVDYITKRVFKAVKKAVHFKNKSVELKSIDDKATSNNLQDPNDIWENVGGMKHIKQSLIEILCWPLKYPVLFPKQSGGVLLFGPPGTGKSLIGSCVAKLSQLSFICVKGPELLSKYIGQSEQAVRNIFEKAEKRKPCILFFDEFDSLAPRRGHDSTGVTDRVVNQLLTQLDGVEGSTKGVTVLAATSRPDLLDGALLRPGRFDITVHCAMPTEAERLEILEVLSGGLKMKDDVSLAELAEMTEGFTGADIKSILSTAQLQCLEEKLDELSTSENPAVSDDEAVVTREHLFDALANTRPSLTPQQLQFYDIIYSRFLNKSLTEEEKTMQEEMAKRQRATLA